MKVIAETHSNRLVNGGDGSRAATKGSYWYRGTGPGFEVHKVSPSWRELLKKTTCVSGLNIRNKMECSGGSVRPVVKHLSSVLKALDSILEEHSET
ncbi:unnamed protein product [Timema podura]|uniref:Uncharacterized protein n=1 Tax=Timema podura TaxID=61482 RepID=A0ABN7NQH1_TIMPD|nr:unnamed protein product [Timema podura]